MLGRDSESLVDHFRTVFGKDPEQQIFRFLVDGEGEPHALTNAEFDLRARTIAAVLRERFPAGERALIMCPAGLDYVVSFFACLYADLVAVPVYPPDPAFLMRTLPRLTGVIEDALPAVVLAPAETTALADRFAELAPALRDIAWLAVDELDTAAADAWRHPGTRRDDLAFLQYTSGSTSRPKGVMVSHANLLHNIGAIFQRVLLGERDQHVVSWLPPFHDMGLIFGLLTPPYAGFPVTFMSPFSFLKRPLRWLRAISDVGGTASAAPNFAYDLAAAKITEAERQTLDLSTWRLAANGAEPVRPQTLEHFTRTFAPSGFRPAMHAPSYGLAEGTLMVSSGDPLSPPAGRRLRTAGLLAGTAEDAGPDEPARTLLSCGMSVNDQRVVAVDPQTRLLLPDGRVGELWVAGPSVAQGYWRREQETEETFRARLAGSGDGPFLRTGDLGFTDSDQIYVTGRMKDVIIVAGRNHYPQDIERTVEGVGSGLRPGCGVAGVREIDGEERLIVVQEYRGGRASDGPSRVAAEIRAEVAREHGLQVYIVVLARSGTVPKTSSGKLQRRACLDAVLAGTLNPLYEWRADGGAPSSPDGAADAGAREPGTARSAAAAPALDAAEVELWLRGALAAATGVQPEAVDPGLPFAAYGLRSVEMVTMVGDLERRFGATLASTVVWEHPTPAKLARYLAGGTPEQAPADTVTPAPPAVTAVTAAAALRGVPGTPDAPGPAEPVAIIGIGCRFPGGVNGPESFWRLLSEGRDAVTEVPAERWDVDEFTSEDPSAPGRTNSRWGGFLDGIDQFDAAFFGIPPQEAARMDPQQRLLAEVAFEALENAGVPTGGLAGSATGVFVGISTFEYATEQFRDLDAVDRYSGTGGAPSIAANRLSYLLDLRGPSMALDTACSSSLVAVLQACVSLERGECDLALAGGVNLVLTPAFAINFSKAGVMSADGRCKPFDSRADGYVRSEGAGVVVLKPLKRALADGDPVYAVIRGGAVNQDGASNGLMAPNPQAQEAVLRAAHRRAGVRSADIGYVEAHGTGTILGDPIEAKALGAVLGDGRDPAEPCLIGSVKSNLGHMEAAAGIGGLIKTALAVRHRTVPATLHYREPNPHIPFDDLAVRVADTLQPWPGADGAPALAGVSSFGFGGTNAHLVLEQPPAPAAPPRSTDGAVLLTVSARDERALGDLAAAYAGKLAAPGLDLSAFACAAAVRRTHHEHRLAVTGSSAGELRAALGAFARGEEADGLSSGVRRVGWRPRTVFVFSGQGPRWWPLATDLLDGEPVFRAVLERCDALLRRRADWSLMEQLNADPAASRLLDTAVGQPALTAVQIALATLWRSWGVEPAAVVGHSVGEIAAAHVAGALTLEDALVVALHRGVALHAATGKGRMAVAGVTLDRAREILAERPPGAVWVAAGNSPNSTVFSGAGPDVEALAKSLEADGVYCRVLESVEFASHCPLMEPVAQELWRLLADLRPRTAALPMVSTVTGRPVDGGGLDAEYWASNLTQPVLFDAAVTALAESGHDVFVELSPHPMLTDAVTERLSSYGHTAAVHSLRRDQPGRAAVRTELGRLYTAGCQVDWTRVYGPAGPMADLPTYPWQRSRHWFEESTRRRPVGRRRGHPVLRSHVRSALAPHAAHWTAPVDLAGFPYLADHRVGGGAVLPAALVLDAALAAARLHLGGGAVLTDVDLGRLTVVPEEADDTTLQLVLVPETEGTGSVRVHTRAGADDDWTEAARGAFRRALPAPAPGAEPLSAARDRCTTAVAADDHYAVLHRSGLEYGPAFQGVEELWRGHGEAVGRLRDPAALTAARGGHLVHPAVLDSALQVLSAALGTPEEPPATYLPVRVGGFTLHTDRAEPRWAHASVTAPEPGAAEIAGASVVLYAEDGAAVGEMTGIALRRLERGQDADPVTGSLYGIDWLPASAEQPAAQPPGSWLLFADAGGTGAALATALGGAGGSCVTATAGAAYRQLDVGRYELDPARREDVAALLADLAAAGTRLDGIVHAWALDAELTDDGGPQQLPAAQDAATGPVLHLVQELARAGQDPAPRLVLLTRGAQRAASDDTLAPGQSPLWGLARVIGLEHTELRPTVVDLDPARPAGEADLLLAELLRPGDDDQVALRGAERLTPALQRWTPPATTPQARPAWTFDAGRDGNHRLLAARPGSLASVTATWWQRTPPGPGQVEIEVAAAGINFSDVLKALDSYPGAQGVVPLGAECAGRVTAVGEGVTRHAVGDRVIAVGGSCLAAFTTVSEHLVAPAPASLGEDEAAAVPIAFLTAVHALERLARLRRGESVLVHSATGGVGLAALQIARRRGARVYATAGTEDKRELLRGLGVEAAMDSRTLAFADEITERTGGRGVDVVLNSTSAEALARSLRLLAPGGRFVEIGKRDIHGSSHIGLDFFKDGRAFLAVDLERTIREAPADVADLFADVVAGFERGDFTALPVTVHPFGEAPAVFATMAQARHTGKLVLRPETGERITTAPGAAPVRPDGTYLITGGLGALGLETARYLADQGARHLVLAGRSAPSAAAEQALAGLRGRAEVAVVAADVSAREGVDALLDRIDAVMPPLAGVVHAAGILDDGMLTGLDRERFGTVAGPKSAAAWHLHQATAERPLDFFVLYSSAAAALGSASQGSYAAASAFLDTLAHHRRSRGLPALSIGWGPWSQIGLAARPDRGGALAARGIGSISPRDGIATLDLLLRACPAHVCVLPLDRDKLRGHLGGGLLRTLLADAEADRPPLDGVRRRMLAVEPGRRRRAVLTEHCRAAAARVVGIEPERIDTSAPITGLGFDSLLSLELRKSLESSLRVQLPSTVTWRFPTIDALVPYLAERMEIELEPGRADAAEPAEEPVRVPAAAAGAAQEPADAPDLDAMSAAELEALLLARTQQINGEDQR
ncbi:type I polyketide synthase [Actinacidiphila bryophytorum]|uniref:Type I polyketide synthase n=1 Tax=Actinacidiphila bryophytorum TaxID=1436133 RepID=A0A9W4H8E6_9ACTN|nr:type I polyketide synthase [Actinacidiphila bryophytorum]MBM9438317.1 SDR family NAD(P)-dependent oxidoreductase [Actinacidiphila bryophytorum]MBN6544613.1 SDR family NAD(P)-dependent oxidoreductase [Actinacidiphila bryophytorum]CAG7657999.1 Type I polyketide synthase [Actinacidiphila bryophytorum]